MGESALLAESRNEHFAPTTSQGFDRLQELMRHGYAPDARPSAGSGGLLLRHEFAPDLILRPDGSVDVPVGQPLKQRPATAAEPPKRKRRWLRTFAILIGITLYTMFALGVTIGIMESL